MKVVEFNDIKNNEFFWLYFLSTSFPLAIDIKEDIDLSDFIYENYDCVSATSEWIDSFVQYTDGIMEENDGYADNPTSIVLSVENEEYIVQYHPGDTLYLQNGRTIASTGPHYDIHKLDYQLFQSITERIDDFQKAILILPIVSIKSSEEKVAKELISQLIQKLPVKSTHHNKIVEMIIEGLKA